jgi:hypothetical protein
MNEEMEAVAIQGDRASCVLCLLSTICAICTIITIVGLSDLTTEYDSCYSTTT